MESPGEEAVWNDWVGLRMDWIRSFSLRLAPSKGWAFLYALICMGGIFYLSSLPGEKLPGWRPSDLGSTLAHVVAYGVLGWCLILVFYRLQILGVRMWIGVMVLVLLYGISDEVHQSFVPTRMPSIGDVAADGIGGLIALLLWHRKGLEK